MTLQNEKGWPCIQFQRELQPDKTFLQKIYYQNPADPSEIELEIGEWKPVELNQVRIRIDLNEKQQKLPGVDDKKG